MFNLHKFIAIIFVLLTIGCKGKVNLASSSEEHTRVEDKNSNEEILSMEKDSFISEKDIKVTQPSNIVVETKPSKKEDVIIKSAPKIETTPMKEGNLPNFQAFQQLLNNILNADGTIQNNRLAQSKSEIDIIVQQYNENFNLKNLSKKELTVFWINTYNLFKIKYLADKLTSDHNIKVLSPSFMEERHINVGNSYYSFKEIEQIFILDKVDDERVMFSLFLGGKSSPFIPKNVFTLQNMDNELEHNVKRYFKKNSPQLLGDKLIISQLFEWHQPRFENVIGFINKHNKLSLKDDQPIEYVKYDWSI